MSQENVEARIATTSDLDGLTATLTAAFEHDPLWSWAFPDPTDLAVWWQFNIGSALRYPWVWISGDYAAASVWIPPDGTELTDEEEARVEPVLRDLIGPRAPEVIELVRRFDVSHPEGPPHYYLSLLGVHPEHRGEGLGMALLAENLQRMDAEACPPISSRAIPETTAAMNGWGTGESANSQRQMVTHGRHYVA
jgi:GNAT superfamily N-acetyltransferase